MILDYAMRCADRLLERFGPFCERIEIAGSIRRRRPACNDVDLVVVPRRSSVVDLFGSPVASRNLLADEITRAARDEGWSIGTSGDEVTIFTARGVQVDIWYAAPETFSTVLLCRTGSKEHNIWLALLALDAGMKWVPNRGLYRSGSVVAAQREEDIYSALGLPWLDPVSERDEPAFRRFDPARK